MQRRELLKMITAATGMAMIGLPSVVFGQAQLPVPPANNAFSKTQVALLDEIAETILPRTDTPGAKDAGVGLFMARFVTDCYDPQQQAVFRAGLADLDKRAKGGFLALKPAQRAELLDKLAAEARAASPDPKKADDEGADSAAIPPHYFTMIKQLVLFGFFTSEVGATKVLRYVPVPGRFDGDLPYEPGTPAWAT
ncbi:gluconate 2-dehydrogenase subunit 3 family protein [Pseudoxanthomonas winnipegensis]|uniref:Gluconate 2-dehydrogenase subunit 3 family protein n=1 Tax=Pseudoxanthomonas winnipegensis TaxID=2480810 RepID=A0A4Q8LYD7_9GAMM|nr:gluconate 2-dehydrogenase subunit 3 family protein [Pseudoxanthomonas winnipegensis]TAA37000.1 gluconate 2-dehydrogenase subunit 3 family protein [Pseudoxanthomonas winnipegensis]